MTDIRLRARHAQALLRFAAAHGRCWKSVLRRAWCSGIYPGVSESNDLLQQVRNTLGPSWLVQVTVAQLRRFAAESAPKGEGASQ